MAKNPNRSIWERAIPLSDAWKHFAPPGERSKYENLSLFQNISDDSQSATFTSAMISVIAELGRSRMEIDKAETNLQEHLLDEIFNSNLIAIGYREKPSMSSSPVRITPDFFDIPAIDWLRDSADAIGRRYNRIRIYDPARLPAVLRRKTGRLGSTTIINSAIEKLINEQNDFCKLPRKEACEKIREIINADNVKGNGLSDVNLSKYILKYCDSRELK